MKRPAKILQLWKTLIKDETAYTPHNKNRDAELKRAIAKNLDKLRLWSKPSLTEQSPEGQEFLSLRDRIAIKMRNYCRTIKHIENKKYLKSAKKLTILVMNLELNQLDDDGGIGSLENAEGVDLNAIEHLLQQGDEHELEENEERDQQMGLPQGLPPQPPPRRLPTPPQPQDDLPPPRPPGPPPVPGLSFARVDSRMQQLVQQYNVLRIFPPTQANLQRLFALSAATRTRHGATPEEVNAVLDQFAAALQNAQERVNRETTLKQERIAHNRDRLGKLTAFARPGRDFFGTGLSAKLEQQKLNPGKHFKAFQAALAAAEQLASDNNLRILEQAAHDYLKHFFNDLDTKEQNSKEARIKKQVCEQALKAIPLERCINELKILGPVENWGLFEENNASSLYAKLLFEAGDQQAPIGGGTANPYWWMEKTVGTDANKKFIFKPSDSEGDVGGFPQGGGATREVLGKAIGDKLQAITGLDLRFPETNLVAIEKSKLIDYRDPNPNAPTTVGSMQHFSKSAGKLEELLANDPNYLQKVPPEECQKMAVLDLLMLNMDRHMGNFLCQEETDANGHQIARLVPIDHGQCLPTREGLKLRQARLGIPFSGLSMIPGSEQPFTPDMLAKIAALNPDEFVQSVRDGQASLQRQFPGATQQANITDENLGLMKRSCQFLKAAAAQGLTPGEMFDAYAHNQEEIFDTPDDGIDAAFTNVIQAVKARSQDRQNIVRTMPTLSDCTPVLTDLQDRLGWPVIVPMTNETAGPNYLQLVNHPELLKAQQNGIPNPLLQADVDEMRNKLINMGLGVPNIPDGTTLLRQKEILDGEYSREMTRQLVAFKAGATNVPGERTEYIDMLETGGEQGLQQRTGRDLTNMAPRDKMVLFMENAIEQWTNQGLLASFQQAYPNADIEKTVAKYRALKRWSEYIALGGDQAFEQAQLTVENDTVYERWLALDRERKLQAAIAALQQGQNNAPPPPQDVPPPPSLQQLQDQIHHLGQEIAHQPALQQRRHSQRLSQALRLSQSGQLDESQKLIIEIAQDLKSSQR